MSANLTYGGCGTCERCEALRWACELLQDKAYAAPLVGALLEARSAAGIVDVEDCEGHPGHVILYVSGRSGVCVDAFKTISTLLAIPPGEQLEATLRAPEATR